MDKYPMNLIDFETQFGTEEACEAYLYNIRWPDGFVCPRCSHTKAWQVEKRTLWQCAACNYQASLIAGTIFQDTHKPLVMWFRAIWWVTVQKNGASALGLQKILGLGSYRTAWTWLHKLRRAMVRPHRERLSGEVEIDETYIGGEKPGKRGRGAQGKTLVVIAAEKDNKGIGRIRMQIIPDASAASLHPFVEANIEPGSTLHIDGWCGYSGIDKKGYTLSVTVIKNSDQTGSELMPRVHRVASLLKRWLLGTHQGGVSPQHLSYYLDEFTFRFNRRKSRSRGLLFYRLVEQAMDVDPVPYKQIAVSPTSRDLVEH
jgi:transposase-like protein